LLETWSWTEKSGRLLFIGDKHQSRRQEGFLFNLLDSLDYDLKPMIWEGLIFILPT
jgi:hypothetical protein